MRDGRWLSPRHSDRSGFERDFPKVDLNGPDVYCPGCRKPIKLGRRGLGERLGGWCNACSRGVTS